MYVLRTLISSIRSIFKEIKDASPPCYLDFTDVETIPLYLRVSFNAEGMGVYEQTYKLPKWQPTYGTFTNS
jgi:hypothetical protein